MKKIRMLAADRRARPFLRMADANYNRAKEALRVCEDTLRFFLNSRVESLRCKRLRHRLSRIFLTLPVAYAKIVASRESATDVGRKRTMRDRKNVGAGDLFLANVKRAEEATRVLEEVSKVLFPKKVSSFERLRFSIYELEKAALRKF